MENNADLIKETFQKGDHIFLEGDQDSHFYIIESGEIQIYTTGANGEQINIIVVTEGESFGEFAMLERDARSASAMAITDCVLIKVTEQGYQKLLEDLPAWASSMLRSFASRLRAMTKRLQNVPQFVDRKSIEESTGKFYVKANKQDQD